MKKAPRTLYKKYIEPYKDLLAYIFWGVITTIINLAAYHLLFNIAHLDYYVSNVIAWIITIIAAYLSNRKYVFHSKAKGIEEITSEVLKFTASRLASFFMEIALLYLGKDLLHLDENLTKYVVTFLVIALNYVLSKLFVFTKKK